MAKFFRAIFNLLLICYIAAFLAVYVPPLVGVTTEVTVQGTTGNQELGTVNYAWRTPLQSLQAGDEILSAEDGSVNVYTVQAVDADNTVVTTVEAAEVSVRTYVYKVLLTVPYLGYIAVCMQTTEGQIILGLVAGVLLLLCILTGIWCRKRKVKRMQEEEEDLLDEDDEENEFFRNMADQKRASDARAEADFAARRASMTQASAAEPAPDEEYEDFPAASDPEPAKEELLEEDPWETQFTVQDAAEETAEPENEAADEEPGREESAAQPEETAADEEPAEASEPQQEEAETETAEPAEEQQAVEKEEPEKPAEPEPIIETDEEMAVERAVETGNIPGVQAALEAALDTQQIQRHVRRNEVIREPEEEPEQLEAEEIELAMPVHTLDEFLQKAYANGEDPQVRKDDLTGVTYVDYSECL